MPLPNSSLTYSALFLLCGSLAAVSGCEQSMTNLTDDNASPAEMDIDDMRSKVTLSGISSGGYMAVQAHVALADRIRGAAALAAGPFHCAEGSVTKALGPCLKGDGLSIEPLLSFARENAGAGKIARLEALAGTRAWVYQGSSDTVVSPVAGKALFDFYAAFMPADNIRYVTSVASGHGWPTEATGVPCPETGGDFINACGFDAAGEFLNFLYDGLNAPSGSGLSASLQEIDLSGIASGSAIADSGFAYVPASCAASMSNCNLHIAFHGCRQGAEFVDDRFASQAGINEWADSNDMVVVYPQIEKSMLNPQGCWDWWGYSGSDYDLASGEQVAAVNAIIEAFARDELLN